MLQTNILFVDVTNNDRSILAEAYFNTDQHSQARAFSAGFAAANELDRHIYEVLHEEGIVPDDYCPKPIDIFLQAYSPRIDLIVGFTPMSGHYKLPLFPHHPPLVNLAVEPVDMGSGAGASKRAFRDCFADVRLIIDRAKASGKLPSMRAA